MKLSDAIRRASELSEAINEYWLRESPKRHPRYPLIYPGEEPPPPPPEEAELEAFLASLPLEDLHRMIAVSEVGKYFCRPREFAAGVEKARQEYPDTFTAALQLSSTGLLHEMFADGLADLRKAGVEVEACPLVPA